MDTTSTVAPLGKEEAARPGAEPEHPDVSGTPDTGDAVPGTSLSKDELFHLLQNSRRRAALRYLRGREGPVRMRDVAEQVAAWEHDTTVAGLSSDERQRVYVALYQSHLDTLADAGVLEYDKPRGVVEPRPLLDRVAAYADPPVSIDETGATGQAGQPRPTDGNGERDGKGGEQRGTEGGGRDEEAENSHRNHGADGGDRGGSDDGDSRSAVADPWTRGFLGVSVLGSVLLAGTALDLAVFQGLSGIAAGALVLLAFVALTVAKLVDESGA